ncbi:MAG: AAA family ATPase [Firmicutes bacterium]|nr:AAA family ATPase [Bacillota bacterium]
MFKKIELYGFKSFADKTEIILDSGITGIVGPNGCGKSNVVDAVRWVLGEQSAKLLRGASMHDVIFAGTAERRSHSYCEVVLHFDNADKKVFKDLEYSEVTISRKLYRDGTSEYILNNKQVRLKDVVELLQTSGVGREGYSIIGQGRIDEILSNKPEARRAIFEEAAGISHYKTKKLEAERKLGRTLDNMTRLNDIIIEREAGLLTLEQQSKDAEKFLEFKDRLKILEINNFLTSHAQQAEQKEKITAKINELTTNLEQKQKEYKDINALYLNQQEQIDKIDKNIDKLHSEILELTVKKEQKGGEIKLFKERLNNAKQLAFKLEFDSMKSTSSIEQSIDALKKGEAELEAVKAQMAQLKTDRKELEDTKRNVIAELKAEAANLENVENQLKELTLKASEISAKIAVSDRPSTAGRLLERTKKASDSDSKRAKEAIQGVVGTSYKVDSEYALAIELALGAAAQNIITQTEAEAKFLVSYLKAQKLGRATFLPLNRIKNSGVLGAKRSAKDSAKDDAQTILASKGALGVASNLISFKSAFKPVFESLLGRTVVFDNINNATAAAISHSFSFRAVTLEGDIIATSGAITGGSVKEKNLNNPLVIEHKKLQEDIKNISKSRQEIFNKHKNTERVKHQVDDSLRLLDISEVKADNKLGTLKAECARLQTQIKNAESEKLEARKALEAHEIQAESLAKQITTLEQSCPYTAKLDDIKANMQDVDKYKQQLSSSMKDLDQTRLTLSSSIAKLTEKRHKEELELNNVDHEIEAMQSKILEDYELDYNACLALKDESHSLKKGTTEANKVKKQIADLGHINIRAIEAYLEHKARFEEMLTQREDLIKAEQDMRIIIRETSEEMLKRFKTEFDKINENFGKTFKALFGGGNAKLVLVEGGESVLDAGIDIVAEPPGKKLKSVSPLSGGERALTAIAILFAILKLKPMPFCFLDEIEAPLDDANAERFAQYLKGFSKNTQFVVVTHKKQTMGVADVLYGVTMPERGVTKMVSVKLQDALQHAQEVG